MADQAASFAMLVHGLVRTHHDSNLRAMARHTGIPYMTLSRWEHGETESQRITRVSQLCRAYGLEIKEVLDLLTRDAVTRAQGGRPAVPTIVRKPGPQPDPQSRRSQRARLVRRAVGAMLFATLSGLSSVSSAATLPVEKRTAVAADDLRLIGRRVRSRRYARSSSRRRGALAPKRRHTARRSPTTGRTAA